MTTRQDIEVVINYDFPAGFQGVEDYVHRIGRTARGTAEGKVCAWAACSNVFRGGVALNPLVIRMFFGC